MESSTRTRLPASRRDAALSPTTLASARDCSAASKSRTTSILVAVCAFSLPMRSRLSKVIVVADHEGFGLGHPDECRDPCSEVRMAVIGHLSRRSVRRIPPRRPLDKFRSAIVKAIIARAQGLARASLLGEDSNRVEVRHYLTGAGRDPYQTWLDRLKDLRARVAIQRRVDRIASGNFGDHKPCRDGVCELRVDVGRATASTTRDTTVSSSCSFAPATSALRRLTSRRP